jgi:type IV secretory pathway VirB4 component
MQPPSQYGVQGPIGSAPIAGQGMPGAAPPVAPVTKSNPNSTQNSLQIAEVRDGVVIMNDGSFRSVVMCRSINFDLMSPEEREAVEFSYQNFLNSLYFELQIFVRSTKVDIRPYLEKLDKIRSEHDNMLLAILMEDYINYIAALADQTNIMDKKFYVVIPFYSNLDTRKVAQASKSFMTTLFGHKEQVVTIDEATLEAAKTELKNRAQTVLSGLAQCGVQGAALDTQELIELYYDSYNPDTATRQQLKNFSDLTAPIVTKGQGYAAQPHLDRELQ